MRERKKKGKDAFLLSRREILEEEYGQTYYVSVPPPSLSLFGAVFSSVIPA
jgi:hypothetical protein